MAQITDKDDTSDSLWQHPNTQTANDDEQTKKDACGGDGAIAATPTPPRAPSATDATKADGEGVHFSSQSKYGLSRVLVSD